MKPRQCWSVLEDRAKQKVSQVQADIVRARTVLETLNASYKRLQFLYEEYRAQGVGADARCLEPSAIYVAINDPV
jgi:hypothetical protein